MLEKIIVQLIINYLINLQNLSEVYIPLRIVFLKLYSPTNN